MEPDADESRLRRGARQWRLALRIVFLLLAVLGWAAFAEHTAHERRLALGTVAQRDANLAIAVEHYVRRVLRNALAVHRLLGDQLAAGASRDMLQQRLADRLQANDAFSGLGLCLPDGSVLDAPASIARLSPTTCAALGAATPPGGQLAVLRPLPAAGALHVPLALPLENDARERLALAVAFTPVRTLLGIMQSVELTDDTAVLLAGSDGQARAAWRSGAGAVEAEGGFAALAGLLRPAGDTVLVDGQPHLVAARTLADAGLGVRVATSRHDALAAFRDRRLRLLSVFALGTGALLAAYLLLSRLHADSVRGAIALSQSRREVEALNAGLEQQVRERTTQLQQAYQDLETFSYAVAHDVRAPLAAIEGFADALEPAVRGGGEGRPLHYLQRIQANARRMQQITTSLLDLGRLTRVPLRKEALDLSAIAQDVLAQLREADPARQVESAVEPGLTATGDPALLRQVLENLLGNAWKFTSRRPLAHIRFGRETPERGGGFFVADDGDGFDAGLAEGLFQPFRRMHDATDFPGTGVGLAAVHRIVTLHGGRISAEARPGEGARFSFTLP
ncbi:sensor histidine kinase [Ramlibacter pallidus]|uniref:histidine kinase n=1 Tax=Ramlibacter pallidus TaxID=2780087 RepID=A0ABR9S599_9BURK|nr:ATP-binding protein [Ramlibacter pallidus]MBE7368656.1 hypothetical protein [Ramlibacter pallidus]